jgi:LuxR family quorum sensing-dependent transcriptional regulator
MTVSFDPAWAFLQNAAKFTTLEELQDSFAKAVGSFGFDRFSCTLIAQPGCSPSPRVLFGRSNKAWDEYYLEQGHMKFDPCVRQIFAATGPFAWSDFDPALLTKEARRVMSEAADADAREGFVVPVIGGGGEFYGVRLSSPEPAFDESARATLHALATVYAFQGVKLLELVDDVETHTPLTRRETECLRWVSEGKSDWDISEILAISEATVHSHVENAKRKIGVKSRVQAAVMSTVRGWLSVNSPIQGSH